MLNVLQAFCSLRDSSGHFSQKMSALSDLSLQQMMSNQGNYNNESAEKIGRSLS
jgi:hypothetical protein